VSGARVVLDTSAYSHFRRGHALLVDRMARADVVLVPTVVIGELEAGFRCGSRYAENDRGLSELLEEPFACVVDVNAGTARAYGRIFAQLRQAGTPIPTNDIWIAACATQQAAQLLTFDRHYGAIADLDVRTFAPA